MSAYNKFAAAVVAAVVQGLAAFGVISPEGSEALIASLSGAVGAILVYLIPNTA